MMRAPSMTRLPDGRRPPEPRRGLGAGLRRLVYGLRTEGSGPRRETAAIALGVFIGCLPFYGLHLLLCWSIGTVLRLNRLKVYLAANISNPFVAPFLLFAELQAGSWVRRGTFHPITLEAVRAAGVATLGIDLLLGSVIVGGALAGLAAWGTYATLHGSPDQLPFVDLVRRASDRYVGISITAWEFARGKLRNDPVYRAAVYDGLITAAAAGDEGTLVDVGCGQGLMLALLAEARRDAIAGSWRHPSDPPCFGRLIGLETRPRVAAIAHEALGDEAEIVAADARASAFPAADIVLLFDVLHLMPEADQVALLSALAASLRPGGAIVIRDADRSAGWRFTCVKAGNRLKALAFGNWRQRFHFRSAEEWIACFRGLGLDAEMRPMGAGTPFGNVLFRVTAAASRETPVAGGPAPTPQHAPAG
jgi:uncharacterized protein (DUF2062 family)/SAM-dependent methyltransferase